MNILFKNEIILTFITIFLSAAGGYIFLKLAIPAGPLLGALFVSMSINIFKGNIYIPQSIVVISRIIAGALIGCRCSRTAILSLKKSFSQILFFTFFMISLSIFSGFIIYKITGIHKATAFFGSAPGGIIDMSLISSEFGADMSVVALIQTLRIIANITLIPFLAKKYAENDINFKTGGMENAKIVYTEDIPAESNEHKYCNGNVIRFLGTVLIAIIGGLFGITLSIPGGALIGAFIFVAMSNAFFVKLLIPEKIKYIIQVLIGAVIGSGVTHGSFSEIIKIILPALTTVALLLTIGILLGLLLNKMWKIDLITALLSTAPGGLTSMSLIALDLRADVAFVTSLQFMRLIVILISYPIIMKMLL